MRISASRASPLASSVELHSKSRATTCVATSTPLRNSRAPFRVRAFPGAPPFGCLPPEGWVGLPNRDRPRQVLAAPLLLLRFRQLHSQRAPPNNWPDVILIAAKKGPKAFTPGLSLSDKTGDGGFSVGLDHWGSPAIAMTNPRTRDALYLGHIFRSDMSGDYIDPWDYWGLEFSTGWKNYVALGMTTPLRTKERRGFLELSNAHGRKINQQPK